jgi:hypothetical protein
MRSDVRLAAGIGATVLALVWGGCSSDGGTGSAAPEIVGCNSVRYQGVTYGSLGCAPGIASFTVSGSQNGNTFCFDITCSAGCISGVTVCSGNSAARIARIAELGRAE